MYAIYRLYWSQDSILCEYGMYLAGVRNPTSWITPCCIAWKLFWWDLLLNYLPRHIYKSGRSVCITIFTEMLVNYFPLFNSKSLIKMQSFFSPTDYMKVWNSKRSDSTASISSCYKVLVKVKPAASKQIFFQSHK